RDPERWLELAAGACLRASGRCHIVFLCHVRVDGDEMVAGSIPPFVAGARGNAVDFDDESVDSDSFAASRLRRWGAAGAGAAADGGGAGRALAGGAGCRAVGGDRERDGLLDWQ